MLCVRANGILGTTTTVFCCEKYAAKINATHTAVQAKRWRAGSAVAGKVWQQQLQC